MATWVEQCNAYGKNGTPFLLLADFSLSQVHVFTEQQIKDEGIKFQFPNYHSKERVQGQPSTSLPELKFEPISFDDFKKAYDVVQQGLHYGNSFLCNLTASTKLLGNYNLDEIYNAAQSMFKVLYKDEWVCFSPERFVLMQNNCISTYPMKGTIDAQLQNAATLILNNEKERAEHFTIVDLLRNDLSQVSDDVQVKRFRYLDEVLATRGSLLQVSSEISGTLPADWQQHIGTMMQKLLPAGSISGAPKQKTVEIINEAEALLGHQRNFYTGIAAWFNGSMLDSCVLIRFIEKLADGSFVYKSGGGITCNSNVQDEYQELQQKIYLPKN